MNSVVLSPVSKAHQRKIYVATLVIPPLGFHYLPGTNPLTIDSYKNVCNYWDVLALPPPGLQARVFIFQLPLSYK